MKVIVVGGTGFVGNYLVEQLKKEYEVITAGTSKQNMISTDITYIDQVEKLPAADAIINLAAYIPDSLNHEESSAETKKCIEVNTLGAYHLLKIAKKRGIKFIQSSSLAVFGSALQQSTNEQTPRKPTSVYGISKHLADCLCEHSATVLCYSSVYGYGQKKNSVLPIFIDQARAGKDMTIFGKGQRAMDFVYVKDVVVANIRALKSGATGFFTIGSGRATTMRELAEKVRAVFGTQKTKIITDSTREEEKVHVSMDITQAKKLLGYTPAYSIDAGLQDYKRMLDGI